MVSWQGLLKKCNKYKWGNVHEAALNKVKEIITNPACPILKHFNPKLTIQLLTDSSRSGIGFCLFQTEVGNKVPLLIMAGSCFLEKLCSCQIRTYFWCTMADLWSWRQQDRNYWPTFIYNILGSRRHSWTPANCTFGLARRIRLSWWYPDVRNARLVCRPKPWNPRFRQRRLDHSRSLV